jgi:hypothetical protein
LQEVRNILATLKTNEEKITTLSELATAVAKKGDKEAAKKILDEAGAMTAGSLKTQANLTSSLQLAAGYALADSEKAFIGVENNIAQMNELINAGIMLEEFYEQGNMQNGELLYTGMNRQGLLHVQNSVDLLKNLTMADFDRTEGLAGRFQRPEIQIFVRLKIVQALLDPEAAEREMKDRQNIETEHDH